MPRKIAELELEFEIPTWNSNWDFEEAPPRRPGGRAELAFENPKAGRVGIPTGILRNLRPGGRVLKNNKILQIINYTKTTTKFY